MPQVPPLRRPILLRLRNVTPQRIASSGLGSYTRPSITTTTTASSSGLPADRQHRRGFTSGSRLWTNEKRERLFIGKELGSAKRLTDEMADRIHRVTMFKIADEAEKKKLIEQYKVLGSSQKKDGKPYILSMVVGPAADDPRSQGFTIVAKTEFASLEDMRYYDDECAAHGALKIFVKENLNVGGIMSVYFKPEAVASL